MESILIFGGGLNQLTLIESAKQLGYKTIVIDPIENAPAKEIADVFVVVPPKDYEKTKEVALKYNVKGIVTCQMENPLLLMAKLADELKFIFPSPSAILKARNKFLMKQSFINNNVPCAKGLLIKNTDEITEDLCKQIGFPLIIKPLDSFSSRGVYKINSFLEINNYLNDTKQFSSTGEILIEEFMGGPEVSVETVTQNGLTTVIQITDKVITPYPTAVEMIQIQPTELNENIQKSIKVIVVKAIKALGLDNCAGHSELKITKDGIKMIELGARLGGDYITSHLVPLSTGVNIEAALIQIAMNKVPEMKHLFQKGAVVEFLNLTPGKMIKKIGGLEKILSDKKVKQAYIFKTENEIVLPITDSAKRVGCVIVQDEDRTKALALAKIKTKEMSDLILLN